MSGAIYMAASGALNQQMYLEVLANNLSNINTVGFKEDRAAFHVADTPNAASEEMAAPRPGSSRFQVSRPTPPEVDVNGPKWSLCACRSKLSCD